MTTLSKSDYLDDAAAWSAYRAQCERAREQDIERAYMEHMRSIVPPLTPCSVTGDGS